MLKMLVFCDSQRVRNNNVLRCDGLCILVENPLKFHNIVLILCPFSLIIENILSCDKLIEVVLIYCGYFRVKKLFTYNEQSLNFIYLNLKFLSHVIVVNKAILLIYVFDITYVVS